LLTSSFILLLFSYIGTNNANARESIVDSIKVPSNPQHLILNPANGKLYVPGGFTSGQLTIIDSLTSKVINNIPLMDYPFGVAFNPANGKIYVTQNGGDVSVIDSFTDSITDTIHLGGGPYGIVYNPANGNMYVTNILSGNLSAIDSTNSVVTRPVGAYPAGIAFNPANGNMYFIHDTSPGVVSVMTSFRPRIIANITVGDNPIDGIAFNPANGNIYVTNVNSNTVSVIDSRKNQVVDTIPVGLFPNGIAFNPANGNMYVSNWNSGNIYEIDTTTKRLVDVFNLNGPKYITHNAANGNMYVSSGWNDTVNVISMTSMTSCGGTAVCPTNSTQHWDKIIFKIVSPELAKRLNLMENTELDIKIKDDPSKATDVKRKVLEFLQVPDVTEETIQIVGVDYAITCSS
jgi:YVTN family beta-propeller protein